MIFDQNLSEFSMTFWLILKKLKKKIVKIVKILKQIFGNVVIVYLKK